MAVRKRTIKVYTAISDVQAFTTRSKGAGSYGIKWQSITSSTKYWGKLTELPFFDADWNQQEKVI